MKTLANLLLLSGSVLLAHAAYSAHEHSSLSSTSTSTPPPNSSPAASAPPHATTGATSAPIPLDITLETLVSLFFLCLGIVLRAPQLRPVQWRVWAGKIEREGGVGLDESGGVRKGVYGGLEERVGLWDIRRKRREFAEWVKEGQGVGS